MKNGRIGPWGRRPILQSLSNWLRGTKIECVISKGIRDKTLRAFPVFTYNKTDRDVGVSKRVIGRWPSENDMQSSPKSLII